MGLLKEADPGGERATLMCSVGERVRDGGLLVLAIVRLMISGAGF